MWKCTVKFKDREIVVPGEDAGDAKFNAYDELLKDITSDPVDFLEDITEPWSIKCIRILG